MNRSVVLAVFTVLAFTEVLLTLARAAGDITVGIQLFAKGQLAEARQFCESFVKEHFEKAVALNPDNIAARSDLMEYYLRAPRILGGSREKAREQAEEIAKRDKPQGHPGNEQWRGDTDGVFTQTHSH